METKHVRDALITAILSEMLRLFAIVKSDTFEPFRIHRCLTVHVRFSKNPPSYYRMPKVFPDVVRSDIFKHLLVMT